MNECKYTLIKKLTLDVHDVFGTDVISAKDLEKLLQNANRVYSDTSVYDWYYGQYKHSNYTALLIAVEELPKEPITLELSGNYESINWEPAHKFLGKKVKVTFEEIP